MLLLPRFSAGVGLGLLAGILYSFLVALLQEFVCSGDPVSCAGIVAWPFHLTYPFTNLMQTIAGLPVLGMPLITSVTIFGYGIPLVVFNSMLLCGLICGIIAILYQEASVIKMLLWTVFLYSVVTTLTYTVTLPLCMMISQYMGRLFLAVCPY